MTTFYLGAVILFLLTALFILWPIIKYRSQQALKAKDIEERDSVNIALYRDHLTDLDNQLEQGAIDQDQYSALKSELDRNLLEDSQETKTQLVSKSNYSWLLWACLIATPVLSLFIYQTLGAQSGWQLQNLLDEQVVLEERYFNTGSEQAQQALIQHNQVLIKGLLKHTQSNPEDLQLKILLARTAIENGEFDIAIEAYQSILEVEPEAAQMMAELAQAIFLKSESRAVPVVGMLTERAINIQPDNVMALGLLGIYYYQQGEYAKAIPHWRKAISLYPPNSPNAQALMNGLTQAEAKLAAAGEAIPEAEAPAAEVSIKVAVSLAESVPVSQSDTVFVYARAWNGPKIPLAITRLSPAQLPLTVELTEAMAMAPNMTLGSFDQVELVARLSPSGNAIAQADDWQISLGPVEAGTGSETVYNLQISKPYQPTSVNTK